MPMMEENKFEAANPSSTQISEPVSADMLDKMQNLEDKIENKLKEIDKMFAVGSPSAPTTNAT